MQPEDMRILSQTKNFITCCTTCCMNFVFALAPQGAPMRVIQVDIEGYCSSSAFMSQLRNFKLRKPVFHNGSQPHLPNICLKERCFLHFTTHKQTCSLFYMEALTLSSKDVCYTNILEMIVQNKKLSVYLIVRCSEMREMHTEFLPNIKNHVFIIYMSEGINNLIFGYS